MSKTKTQNEGSSWALLSSMDKAVIASALDILGAIARTNSIDDPLAAKAGAALAMYETVGKEKERGEA